MNPFASALLRLSGIAPLTGPIPLSEAQQQNLFRADPSFVDYFPVIDYDEHGATFAMDDGINVGAVYELSPADLDAKPEASLGAFNDALAMALQQLPQEEENPYVVQLFLENAAIANLGDYIVRHLPQPLREDRLSLAVAEMMRTHHELLTHEQGAFPDSRVSQEKGWRVSTQKIYLCVYRLESEGYWKKSRKSPTKALNDDIKGFLLALNGLRVASRRVDDRGLINWLGGYFSSGHFTELAQEPHAARRDLANYDVGQQCFTVQPEYLGDEDPEHRGIWKFGARYIRYLTTSGLQNVPEDGCLTLGRQGEGSDKKGSASIWEQMPPGTMMTWTIVPQPKAQIDLRIDRIMASAQQGASAEANWAEHQAQTAKEESMRNNQRIFYTQIGAYISAPDKEALLDRSAVASNILGTSNCLGFIKPEYDLISQDSFIRALPFVYDFRHDRKAALRARMTYLSQLSATLPLFGSGKGSAHLCYLMFKRSGEPFMCNPFLKSDRARVAHQVVFGPTGSGKSATMNYMAMMSMAVNAPRQFILDKGNSFGLLAQYYQAMGKKVVRLTFNAASKDTFPPFFATREALREVRSDAQYEAAAAPQQGDANSDPEDTDADDARSYLSEMLNVLKIMVTGGRARDAEALTQSDVAFLQDALIEALHHAHDSDAAHARPQDVYAAMRRRADAESIETLAVRYRDFAAAVQLWTQGPRGRLFNQYGNGFDRDADLTLIETGSLTNEGNEDMFAVAGLSTLTNITALGERTQSDGRHSEVFVDEGHYWMQLQLLIRGMIQATKVWRKLGIWMIFATQDFSDFDQEAKKILSQSEFWWLLSMGEDEASQVAKFKDLSDEEKYLIRQAIIEKPYYTEGTLLSERFGCGLNRYIPPSLVLALAQTDQDEKSERRRRMEEQGITELEAALQIGAEIDRARRQWQEAKNTQ